MAFVGALFGVAMFVPDSAMTSVLVAAVLGLMVIVVAKSASPALGGARAVVRSRAALERLIPIAAQSDPDARGHARPRAPGILLPAI